MPLYEYECDACSRRFERIQKFSDPHVDTCPFCGGTAQRQVSSPAIQFKGSGWYITDYARKGGEKGSKESSKPGDSTSSESKSTEAKTSTATETPKPAASPTKKETKSSS